MPPICSSHLSQEKLQSCYILGILVVLNRMTFCIHSTELQIVYIKEDANVQVQKRKRAKLCCVVASKGQSGKKWEERGGQGQITEDFVNQCNNLAFYCACSKRLSNSFFFF